MTDRQAIVDDLRQFIHAHALGDGAVTGETDLLAAGLLDSMLVIDLISHVEATHGVRIEDSEITPEHFRAVVALAELISQKRPGGP